MFTRATTENPSLIKDSVVLVPFPFDDLSSSKVRPALCLTEPIGWHRHVVMAFITSRFPEREPHDVIVSRDLQGFLETGLRAVSVIRLHRLITVATSIILRELGKIPPELQKELTRTSGPCSA